MSEVTDLGLIKRSHNGLIYLAVLGFYALLILYFIFEAVRRRKRK